MSPMTDAEFEKWWEGLRKVQRTIAVLGIVDQEGYPRLPRPGGWPMAGYLLDYACTHEPPAHIKMTSILDRSCVRSVGNVGWVAYLWSVSASGVTGPAAVAKAFVKAHKVGV